MRAKRSGFSLTEVIVVITILLIMFSVLIPSILSVQKKAKQVETEALFGRIINALTLYRKDNGFFPQFENTSVTGDQLISLRDNWTEFAEIMALSQADGSLLVDISSVKEDNPRLKRYFELNSGDIALTNGLYGLVDAFGNPNIFIILDADMNGIIDKSLLPEPAVQDLRQRIVVYTESEEDKDYPELKSW